MTAAEWEAFVHLSVVEAMAPSPDRKEALAHGSVGEGG